MQPTEGGKDLEGSVTRNDKPQEMLLGHVPRNEPGEAKMYTISRHLRTGVVCEDRSGKQIQACMSTITRITHND